MDPWTMDNFKLYHGSAFVTDRVQIVVVMTQECGEAAKKSREAAIVDANDAIVQFADRLLASHVNLEFGPWVEEQVEANNSEKEWALPVTPDWAIFKLRNVEPKFNMKGQAEKLGHKEPACFAKFIKFYDANAELSKELTTISNFQWEAEVDAAVLRAKSTHLCSTYTVWKNAFLQFSKYWTEDGEDQPDHISVFKDAVAVQVDKIFERAWAQIMETTADLVVELVRDRVKFGIFSGISEDRIKQIKAAEGTCQDASFLLTGLDEKHYDKTQHAPLQKITEFMKTQLSAFLEIEKSRNSEEGTKISLALKSIWEVFQLVLGEDVLGSKIKIDIEIPEEKWRRRVNESMIHFMIHSILYY